MNSWTWQRIGQPRFGLADRISDAVAARQWAVPNLLSDIRIGREVLIASDIGGDHRQAKYRAFGFLLAEVGSSRQWMQQRLIVRQTALPDGRRMSYKALRDRVRSAALSRFLHASASLRGNLVVFLVSRDIPTLFSDPGDPKLLPKIVVPERGWRQTSFERLLSIGTFGAVMLAGLSRSDQDVLWVSDQDEIAPNPIKHNHAGHVISRCIEQYAPDHRGLLTFVTTEGAFDRCFREDLVALPDLAAGALVDAYSIPSFFGTSERDIWLPSGNSISPKAKSILKWLASSGPTLRCIVVVLRPDGDSVSVRVFRPTYDAGYLFCLA